MAEGKLWSGYRLRALIVSLMTTTLTACHHINEERPVGITLIFTNVGKDSIVVTRFDLNGLRGPVPGVVGHGGGAQMAFMPGDRQQVIPQFVEVEWVEPDDAFKSWTAELGKQPASVQYSRENRETNRKLWSANPRYARRIDLIPIITPELLAEVQTDHLNTQLKLTITFDDDDVNIKADAYRWRNR